MGYRVGRDGADEYDLGAIGHFIKGWKKWYFKKNSAKPAKIMLRCNHSSEFNIAWKYFLELWVGGKLQDQCRIQAEAYDVYTRDPDCEKSSTIGLEFIKIHEHTPMKKDTTKKENNLGTGEELGFTEAVPFQKLQEGQEFVFHPAEFTVYSKKGDRYINKSSSVGAPCKNLSNTVYVKPNPKKADSEIIHLGCPECKEIKAFVEVEPGIHWCEACGKEYHKPSDTFVGQKNIYCDTCEDNNDKQVTAEEAHQLKGKCYQCNECGKKYLFARYNKDKAKPLPAVAPGKPKKEKTVEPESVEPNFLTLDCPQCKEQRVFEDSGFFGIFDCKECGTTWNSPLKVFELAGHHELDPKANEHGVYCKHKTIAISFTKSSKVAAAVHVAITSAGEFKYSTALQQGTSAGGSYPSVFDKPYKTEKEAVLSGISEIKKSLEQELKKDRSIDAQARLNSALRSLSDFTVKYLSGQNTAPEPKPAIVAGKKKKSQLGKGLTALLGKEEKGLAALLEEVKPKEETKPDSAVPPGKQPKGKKQRYAGAKGSSGTPQHLINNFPPHKIFIEGFLGSGAISWAKKPAAENYGVEINETTLNAFTYPLHVQVVQADVFQWLQDNWHLLTKETLLYLDPPYPVDSIKSQYKLYDYSLTDQQHLDLLKLAISMPCMVCISSYKNSMYDVELKDWRQYSFNRMTAAGVTATETLYMNYQVPERLHQYDHLGQNFTRRQNIKRKIARWVDGLKRLPAQERNAIITAIQEKV